jgi:hypothetical protein
MSMLRDADLSLSNWLKQVLPPGTGVSFDAPRGDWEKRRSGSAFVSAFLREVRRDAQDLPRSGWSDARDESGRLVGRQPAPRYYRLGYLVTAWAEAGGGDGGGDETSRRTLEEHELLGLLIDACTATEAIPDDQLTGSLAEAGIPCFVRCAGDDTAGSTQGLWSGFGIAPHAHLELELVAPVVPAMVTELAPPARQIVVSGRQIPALGRSGGGAVEPGQTGSGPADRPPVGTARRWERRTIVERPAAGKPEPPGQSQ